MRRARPIPLIVLVLAVSNMPGQSRAFAQEKLILLSERIEAQKFSVAADGSKVYLAGGNCAVLDGGSGRLLQRFQAGANDLAPLPDGWFVLTTGGPPWVGRVALVRPDGTEARRIVGKGGAGGDWTSPDFTMEILRADMTGWTSPCGLAVDPAAKLIFAIDTTMAQRDDRNLPDPDWSRIAAFNFDGKFLRDLHRYNALARNAKDLDDRRTWYHDLEVDPARKRVYATTRRFNELLCFDYEGRLVRKFKPRHGAGGLAVFPDGRIAVGSGWNVAVYDPEFRELTTLETPPTEYKGQSEGIRDLETDAAGRLYALVGDPTVAFLRWTPDLKQVQAVGGPDYLRITASFPKTAVRSDEVMMVKVTARGRPEPKADNWRAYARPAHGANLAWRSVSASYREGILGLYLRKERHLWGICDVAIVLGQDPIDVTNRKTAPYVQGTIALAEPNVEQSIAVISASGRRAFRQGEPIPLQIVRRSPAQTPAKDTDLPPISIELAIGGPSLLITTPLTLGRLAAVEVPGTITRRLAPGQYYVGLRPRSLMKNNMESNTASYDLQISIVPSEPDSPVQRVAYHEMGNAGSADPHMLPDLPEKLAFARDWADGMARLHINRETDRVMAASTWRRDATGLDLSDPAFAPAEYYGLPNGSGWAVEHYLDQAVRCGIPVDSQILGHCSGVRFRDYWLDQLCPQLQRAAQGRQRFPSFFGFNYNDEMFFRDWVTDWTASDDQWLKEAEERHKGAKNPRVEARMEALRRMYDGFNAAVAQAAPEARRTCTPMWQFPAVEGSYPPVVYKDLTETYSHYVSEGYHIPWYAPHSVENLRRPRPDGSCLPLIGVIDPGVGFDWGYDKNAMQILGRGVQGVGFQYNGPWNGPLNDSLRTANLLAKMYGGVFGQCPPANEAAILYSYSQDITERRNGPGTPHWERVYELFGAGLMAGVPASIVCEEDVVAGYLLDKGRPRTGMLFLVGQKEPLPEKVRQGIAAFVAASGKLFLDADSADYPGAARLTLATHETGPLHGQTYAADSAWPMMMPVFEKLAADLHKAVGPQRRFPVDTDDPWIAKNQFDGGAVRYILLATEVSPYPWDAGGAWSLMSAAYNGQWLPKIAKITFPMTEGVIYDVFERKLIDRDSPGKTVTLPVDLTTYPGKLLAITPEALAAPRVEGAVRDGTLHYRVTTIGVSGKRLAARVPLAIGLAHANHSPPVFFQGTGVDGTWVGALPLPLNSYGRSWTLVVAELLSGQITRLKIPADSEHRSEVLIRDDVEIQRTAQIAELIEEAKKTGITLVLANLKTLAPEKVQGLIAALRARGVEVRTAEPPKEPAPGVYLAAGCMAGSSDPLGPMLRSVQEQNLLDYPLTARTVPGPGRGLVSAVFAPRGWRENAIVLVGGDEAGLAKTVDAFVKHLSTKSPTVKEGIAGYAGSHPLTGAAGPSEPMPRLSEMTGLRLTGIQAAGGQRLLITAEGFLKNVVLVRDAGGEGEVVGWRVGQSRAAPGSPYVSAGGALLGASARVTADFGEAFVLIDRAAGTSKAFAAFGDMPPQTHAFAANDAGDTVLCGGVYGVVCWKKDPASPGGWKEAWAIDHWKEFDRLDWPVSAEAERIPQFNAYIPQGADYALIVFNEFSQNGWVTPEHFCRAYVAKVSLADGKQQWRFDVPVPNTQLWPSLVMTADGKRLLLKVQLGGWNRETFRYFSLDPQQGKSLGCWDSTAAPGCIALADSGLVAIGYKGGERGEPGGRLLEVRNAEGKLVYNVPWESQPVSLAFGLDGKRLYVADDAGEVRALDDGGQTWSHDLGCCVVLAVTNNRPGQRLYAAGRDGRLRCFEPDGKLAWTLDLTPTMKEKDARPMDLIAQAGRFEPRDVIRASRPSNVSPKVPEGPNLLAGCKAAEEDVKNAEGKVTGRRRVTTNGRATLSLGGTGGWMSDGRVEIQPELLANGKTGDCETPWLHPDEMFWDGCAGRQVYAMVEFARPTDVRTLTVYENPRFPASWPTQGLVQVWEENLKQWTTARMGLFLQGPVSTYEIHLKGVTKLRYVPWSNYFRNFYTSEIELR